MARLRVLKDGVEIQSIDLASAGKSSVVLGRAEGADIRIDDRAIGREHAVFLVSSNGVMVQKKSKFGKLALNGAEVSESPLKSGDVINIADYQVRVEEGAAAVAQPTGGAAASVANEVTPPQGTPAPALDTPPDLAAVPEERTPGLGQPGFEPAADAVPGLGAEASAEGAPPLEAPIDAGAPAEIAAPVEGLAEEPTGGVPTEDANVAEGGDRTAMISTAHVDMRLVFKPGEANVTDFVIKKSEIAIGRGSTCDVIINDKKSSRKHLIIKRVGMNFVAQDLGSSNGTTINGNKFSEQELAGNDVIRIGETEFIFKAESAEYFQQEQAQEFISPPVEEEPLPDQSGMGLADGGAMQVPGMPIDPATGLPMAEGVAGIGGAFDPSALGGALPGGAKPQEPMPKDLIGKLKYKWRQLPPKKQKLYAGMAIMLALVYVFSDDDPPAKKPAPKPAGVVAGASGMGVALTAEAAFKALPPEKQQFVVNEYQLALDLYKNKDFEKSRYELEKLHGALPQGYKDSKDIETYARKAVDLEKQIQAENDRKKAEEDNRKALVELVTQAQTAFDAGKDTEVRDLCAKVLEKDPENPTVLRLRQQMDERDQAKRQKEELAKEQEFQKKQHEAAVKEGQDMLAAGKYYEVIDKMADALTLLGNDPEATKAANDIIQKAKDTLKQKSLPHMAAAKAAFDSGDLQKARSEFYAALAVDSHLNSAREGIAKIREIVHERSRKIYIEAIAAEAGSDFRGAKDRYKECFDSAVKEDSYYGMCQRKYKRFELLGRVTASYGGGSTVDPAEPKPMAAPAPSPGDEPMPEAPPEGGAAGGAPAPAPSAAAPGAAAPGGGPAPGGASGPPAAGGSSGGSW